MDAEQLKDDVRSERIDADRLVDLIVMLQKQLQDAQRRVPLVACPPVPNDSRCSIRIGVPKELGRQAVDCR